MGCSQLQLSILFAVLQGVLCDNLLCANCSPAALGQLCILGNSFATYQQRWSGPEGSRPKTRRPDMLLQLVEQGGQFRRSPPFLQTWL